MTRPPSIVRFERLWFASLAAWSVGTLLAWERTQNSLVGNAQSAPIAGWAQPAYAGMIVTIALIQWYFVARRPMPVVKWLVAAMAAIGGLRALFTLYAVLTARYPHPWSRGSFILAALLAVLAAAALFRADARAWFGEDEPEALPD
jgi:hypothetical protein